MSKLLVIIHNDLKVIYGQFLSERNIITFLKIQLYLFVGFFKRVFFYIKIYKKNSINEYELRKIKNSDTLFIFGSGSSINEISDEEYKNIGKHDVAGFSKTILLEKVNYTYYLDRGGASNKGALFYQKKFCKYFVKKISENKYFNNTIFILPSTYVASFTNFLFGDKIFPITKKFFLFITNRFNSKYPTSKFEHGLSHRAGSLCDVINFGVIMNYKRIVLVGVDLYNNQYFFCPPNKTTFWDHDKNDYTFSDKNHKGTSYNSQHNTVNLGIIDILKNWNIYLKKKQVSLEVYNKKSLLAEYLKIYNS